MVVAPVAPLARGEVAPAARWPRVGRREGEIVVVWLPPATGPVAVLCVSPPATGPVALLRGYFGATPWLLRGYSGGTALVPSGRRAGGGTRGGGTPIAVPRAPFSRISDFVRS